MSTLDKPVNLQDTAAVCELFERAAEVNLGVATRRGSVVDLPDKGRLLITGDLHDNRHHYEKILKLARLNAADDHHLVLQELSHGEHLINGMDLSYRMLARAAELKLARPEQVHHVLSNHELAQVKGDGILKDSVSVVEAFNQGLEYVFGEGGASVLEAMGRYVKSLPLAVRTASGLFVAHSLPTARQRELFDPKVLERVPTDADYATGGSAYMMVWGRGYTQKWADELAAIWGVKLYVLGHQHADMGYDEFGDTMLIVNSDHSHGVALPIDLARSYTRDELMEEMVPLAAIL